MRTRTLKPALFKNEVLGAADPLITLLFEGLWCEADREGRLEDRPARLRAEVFPYRNDANVDAMLDWLASNEFIIRYVIDGKRLIQITKFLDHQRPHKNEQPSSLPMPKAESTKRQGTKQAQPRKKAGTTKAVPTSLLTLDTSSLDGFTLDTHTARPKPGGEAKPDPDDGLADVLQTQGEIQAEYPRTTNPANWMLALRTAATMVSDGEATWLQLHAGVRRYRAYVDAGGVSGPGYVMAPQRFLGRTKPDEPAPWSLPWDPPPSKAQAAQDANLEASRQWLAREEARDAVA